MIRSNRASPLRWFLAVAFAIAFGLIGGRSIATASTTGDPYCFLCLDGYDTPLDSFCEAIKAVNGNWHEDWPEETPLTNTEADEGDLHPEGCNSGPPGVQWCALQHSIECESRAPQEFAELNQALRKRDYASAALVLAEARFVEVNYERDAIQVWDCKRAGILKHIPLNPVAVSKLQTEAALLQRH